MMGTMSLRQPENWLYEIWQKGYDSPCYVMVPNAKDLVKSHLMIAVREEVEVLKERISELMDKINKLELENNILKSNIPQETLQQLQMQLQIAGSQQPAAVAAPPATPAIQAAPASAAAGGAAAPAGGASSQSATPATATSPVQSTVAALPNGSVGNESNGSSDAAAAAAAATAAAVAATVTAAATAVEQQQVQSSVNGPMS